MRKFLMSAAMVVCMTQTVGAQVTPPGVPCHKASEIAKQLREKYKEAPIAFGLQANGSLLQIYHSQSTGTWTAVITTPEGISCVVSVGKGWEQLDPSSDDPMA